MEIQGHAMNGELTGRMKDQKEAPEELGIYLYNSAAPSFNSLAFAQYMDSTDPLRHLRQEFQIPKTHKLVSWAEKEWNEKDLASKGGNGVISNGTKAETRKECIYFCGNSLGLMPNKSRELVNRELKAWAELGVHGHFRREPGQLPWAEIDKTDQAEVGTMASLVGALPHEVTICNSLTGNLHSLFTYFYKPTPDRHKVLVEHRAFSSDIFAIESHIRIHSYDPATTLMSLSPRQGEHTLRTEDILELIEREGHTVALFFFSAVHFYTGQWFEMQKITTAAKAKGIVVGWDLAHAAGNVPLRLHDWNVDFAAWCTYKYLNSGPGGIGAIFVHEKCAKDLEGRNRLAGWWGMESGQRFAMTEGAEFRPRAGAGGFTYSNPCVLAVASLMGSLQVFGQTNMEAIRTKSRLLTGYLFYLLQTELSTDHVRILTPADPNQRGAQISLELINSNQLDSITKRLTGKGIVCDERRPSCIRLSPSALYSKFEDVWECVGALKRILLESGARNGISNLTPSTR